VNRPAFFVTVFALAACAGNQTAPTTASSPAAAPPGIATAAGSTPAASAPAPTPEPGERPSVACAASHPIAALPLAAVNVDAWAQAIAGYRPQANGGRPVAWEGNEGAVKAYLEAVHACVHVAFADSFLASLRSLPAGHPLADPELATTVELVVNGESGALEQLGVVASSGVAELDAAAVAAFGAAFPLAPPPAASLSSDGNLYVTWELHRRREEACGSARARAWKLRF
jgi:hypothetical protein